MSNIRTSESSSGELGENEYAVEYVYGKRFHESALKYLVKWENYPTEESSFEPFANLSNVHSNIQGFERKMSALIFRVSLLNNAKDRLPPIVPSSGVAGKATIPLTSQQQHPQYQQHSTRIPNNNNKPPQIEQVQQQQKSQQGILPPIPMNLNHNNNNQNYQRQLNSNVNMNQYHQPSVYQNPNNPQFNIQSQQQSQQQQQQYQVQSNNSIIKSQNANGQSQNVLIQDDRKFQQTSSTTEDSYQNKISELSQSASSLTQPIVQNPQKYQQSSSNNSCNVAVDTTMGAPAMKSIQFCDPLLNNNIEVNESNNRTVVLDDSLKYGNFNNGDLPLTIVKHAPYTRIQKALGHNSDLRLSSSLYFKVEFKPRPSGVVPASAYVSFEEIRDKHPRELLAYYYQHAILLDPIPIRTINSLNEIKNESIYH